MSCIYCNNKPDRICSCCDAPICDDHDHGNHSDQKSLCCECKGDLDSGKAKENSAIWEQRDVDLKHILSKLPSVRFLPNIDDRMFILKFSAVASNIGWQVTSMHPQAHDLSLDEYRRMKQLILEGIDKARVIVDAAQ